MHFAWFPCEMHFSHHTYPYPAQVTWLGCLRDQLIPLASLLVSRWGFGRAWKPGDNRAGGILLVMKTINHGLPFSPMNYLFKIYLFHTINSIYFSNALLLWLRLSCLFWYQWTNHDSTFKWAMATKWDCLIPPPPLIHVPVYKLANNRGWEIWLPGGGISSACSGVMLCNLLSGQ